MNAVTAEERFNFTAETICAKTETKWMYRRQSTWKLAHQKSQGKWKSTSNRLIALRQFQSDTRSLCAVATALHCELLPEKMYLSKTCQCRKRLWSRQVVIGRPLERLQEGDKQIKTHNVKRTRPSWHRTMEAKIPATSNQRLCSER